MTKQDEVSQVMSLLYQTTTLPVVRNYLKEKGLYCSAGSWVDFEHKRVRPALDNEDLTKEDLYELLRLGEEYGKQHVFLYDVSTDYAKSLIDESWVQEKAEELEIEGLLEAPIILEEPPDPTISDIRIEYEEEEPERLVIKIVDSKSHMELVSENKDNDGNIIKKYKWVSERSVNVVRLHSVGILEVRIGSRKSSSNYMDELQEFLDIISPFIPQDRFRELPLFKAKERLWYERDNLKNWIRYSDSTLRNANGTVLRAATGSADSDLFDDRHATSSVEAFISKHSNFDGSNIWFKGEENGLTRDVHVLLGGLPNEFAIPAHCPPEDYEYVLQELRKLNTPVPS